jgi:hypothetical protein
VNGFEADVPTDLCKSAVLTDAGVSICLPTAATASTVAELQAVTAPLESCNGVSSPSCDQVRSCCSSAEPCMTLVVSPRTRRELPGARAAGGAHTAAAYAWSPPEATGGPLTQAACAWSPPEATGGPLTPAAWSGTRAPSHAPLHHAMTAGFHKVKSSWHTASRRWETPVSLQSSCMSGKATAPHKCSLGAMCACAGDGVPHGGAAGPCMLHMHAAFVRCRVCAACALMPRAEFKSRVACSLGFAVACLHVRLRAQRAAVAAAGTGAELGLQLMLYTCAGKNRFRHGHGVSRVRWPIQCGCRD